MWSWLLFRFQGRSLLFELCELHVPRVTGDTCNLVTLAGLGPPVAAFGQVCVPPKTTKTSPGSGCLV